jgi:hypothetical protein
VVTASRVIRSIKAISDWEPVRFVLSYNAIIRNRLPDLPIGTLIAVLIKGGFDILGEAHEA